LIRFAIAKILIAMPTKEEEELNFRNDAIKTIQGLATENARLKKMYGKSKASSRGVSNSTMPKGLATLKDSIGSMGKPSAPYKSKNSLDLSDLT
jgi:hypothetical protein